LPGAVRFRTIPGSANHPSEEVIAMLAEQIDWLDRHVKNR
jgi:hypothetical protein